jgi:zinc D-Ala-D-Ala carboxypeptidase
MSISKEEVLMGRIKYEDLSDELKGNLNQLVAALNVIRKAYNKPMIVSSGYRSPAKNAAIGGAKKSHHMTCRACDFKDSDGLLDAWCLANQDLLEANGLWQEDPAATPGWVHLDQGVRDTTKKREHKRVFKP